GRPLPAGERGQVWDRQGTLRRPRLLSRRPPGVFAWTNGREVGTGGEQILKGIEQGPGRGRLLWPPGFFRVLEGRVGTAVSYKCIRRREVRGQSGSIREGVADQLREQIGSTIPDLSRDQGLDRADRAIASIGGKAEGRGINGETGRGPR